MKTAPAQRIRLGGNKFGVFAWGWDNWWFRVFGKGLSVEPLEDDMHLFSTRNAKRQPLHIFNHCIKFLT